MSVALLDSLNPPRKTNRMDPHAKRQVGALEAEASARLNRTQGQRRIW